MAFTTASALHTLNIHYTKQDFGSHTIITIPDLQTYSEEEISAIYAKIRHDLRTTALDTNALISALESAACSQKSRVPPQSILSRSPTLPLSENLESEIDRWTGNQILASTNVPTAVEAKSSGLRAGLRARRASKIRKRAPQNKLPLLRNTEPLVSSAIDKRSSRNKARISRHSKQRNMQEHPQEYKTRSGRISKKPKRFGFT